jgi:hypothetical protein
VNEINEQLRVVPERDQMQELLERCRSIGCQSPEVNQLQALATKSEEELLKEVHSFLYL